MDTINLFISRIMNIETVRRQSIVSFIWQVALTFIGFLSTMYFAHNVGASILGIYFLFLAYLNIINLVTDGGFGGAVVKRISEREQQNEYFTTFVVIRSMLTIAILLTLIYFQDLFAEFKSANLFTWLIVTIFVSILYGTVNNGMQGIGKIGVQSTGEFINNVSRIVFQVIAVYLGFNAAGLVGGFVFGMVVGSLVQLRFLDLHFVRFKRKHLKNLTELSMWIFLITGGSIVFSTADTIMIGYYMDNADVGVYRVVLQFTSIAAFATTALRSTLYPKVSHWGKIGDMKTIENSLQLAFTYSMILALPLLVGGLSLGDKLLFYFYGSDFVSGYFLLIILFLVQIINIFYYFFNTYLTALGYHKQITKITIISVVANILLNGIMIPLIGIEGAGLATLATMALNAILAKRLLSKVIAIRLDKDTLLNVLKALIFMSVVLEGFKLLMPLSNIWILLILVFLGGGIYAGLLVVSDQKIKNEIKKLSVF